MAFTYTLSTDAGKVRLMLPDNNPTQYVFEDDEIAAFLELEYSNTRRATALALETIASNEAYTLKVIKLLDLQTDGAKTSDALLKRAALLLRIAISSGTKQCVGSQDSGGHLD